MPEGPFSQIGAHIFDSIPSTYIHELCNVLPQFIQIYTEQKWKRYTSIIYILRESIWLKVFTKA